MLIQNVNNLPQASTPVRLAGSGAPDAAVVTPSKVETSPAATATVGPVMTEKAAAQQPTPDQLQNMVDNINQTLKQSNKNLEFSVDADTQKPVVKLVDTETGDVIRQVPSEEALAISRAIDQFRQGLLLKQEA